MLRSWTEYYDHDIDIGWPQFSGVALRRENLVIGGKVVLKLYHELKHLWTDIDPESETRMLLTWETELHLISPLIVID